jgi:methionyl-tRNA synthetase
VLYTTLEAVRVAAVLVQPVMPDSAAALLDLLGQPPGQRDFSCLGVPLAPGIELPAPRAVFPRYEAPD